MQPWTNIRMETTQESQRGIGSSQSRVAAVVTGSSPTKMQSTGLACTKELKLSSLTGQVEVMATVADVRNQPRALKPETTCSAARPAGMIRQRTSVKMAIEMPAIKVPIAV